LERPHALWKNLQEKWGWLKRVSKSGRGERTKSELKLNRGAVQLFEKVLGKKDPKAIADDIFNIILAEFEWNSEYKNAWRQLEGVERFVYPA